MAFVTNTLWPEDELGCPLRVDYNIAPDEQFARTEVADGPPRYRRMKLNERRLIRMSFAWTVDQLDLFERFVDSTLEAGMRWFMMDQMTGRGMQPMYCHLMPDPWEITPNRDRLDRWQVAITVEAFHSPQSLPPPGITGVPYDGGAMPSPADPANTLDAGAVSGPRPTDINDSLTPGLVY
jgi:hypothetical protein